jgi:hypothetical protein
MPSSLPRVAAYIDPELEQQLQAFCQEQNFSTSEAIAHILNHFFGRLPSELLETPSTLSRLDDLAKRLEVVEQAIGELQREPLSKPPNKSSEPLGELPSSIPNSQEPTGEFPSESLNQELTEELPDESPSQELTGEFPSESLNQEPTEELPDEPPSQEPTGELLSELPVRVPHPIPEEGLSTVELADLTGVTAQQVNRIRRQGKLDNWKGGWRAVKINEKEHRYYPLGQA